MFLPVEFSSAKGSMSYNPCQFDVILRLNLRPMQFEKLDLRGAGTEDSAQKVCILFVDIQFVPQVARNLQPLPVLLPGRQPQAWTRARR